MVLAEAKLIFCSLKLTLRRWISLLEAAFDRIYIDRRNLKERVQ
jgi:hypothetical protein